MKFVVNKIHKESSWQESDLQNCEFLFNKNFKQSPDVEGYCSGDIVGIFIGIPLCTAFTIAEVPDTIEGYYLL